MMNLTFGEQVKIILGRKGMTIKELAEQIEKYTGKPMSRQNMTQRLGRDNFQEQDMRMIAKILGCHFTLEIKEAMEENLIPEQEFVEEKSLSRDVTVGEFLDAFEDIYEEEEVQEETVKETAEEVITKEITVEEPAVEEEKSKVTKEKEVLRKGISGYFMRRNKEAKQPEKVMPKEEASTSVSLGEINPYTGREYETNSVRMHPKRIGYVQVYDQEQHMWTEMTEWAFLGYQERKKRLLGKDYKEPIYLD